MLKSWALIGLLVLGWTLALPQAEAHRRGNDCRRAQAFSRYDNGRWNHPRWEQARWRGNGWGNTWGGPPAAWNRGSAWGPRAWAQPPQRPWW